MSDVVLVAVVGVGSAIVTGILKLAEIWWTNKVNADKKQKYSIPAIVDCDYQIDKHLWDILMTCKADRVSIWRFHNGTNYANGVPMEKLSMTNEVFQSPNVSVISQFQNRLISEFAAIVQPLVFQGVYEQQDVEHIEHTVLQNVCQKITSKAMSLFLISDNIQKPTACIVICWNRDNSQTTTDAQKIEIMHTIQMINPLLNIKLNSKNAMQTL